MNVGISNSSARSRVLSSCHVVWDWNGTLFNDADTTVALTIDALRVLGAAELTPAFVKSSHRRPLIAKFGILLGRPISPEELQYVLDRYATEYESLMFDLSLATDARAALSFLAGRCDQSILSLAPQMQLDQLLSFQGIGHFFSQVLGADERDDGKKERLRIHCEECEIDGRNLVVIGDTVDDFEAAEFVGATAILVPRGIQSVDDLMKTGAILSDCVLSAAVTAVQMFEQC